MDHSIRVNRRSAIEDMVLQYPRNDVPTIQVVRIVKNSSLALLSLHVCYVNSLILLQRSINLSSIASLIEILAEPRI
jgi:hypothetical protein